MKTKDVQDDLAGNFEVSPLPPIGPEGAPVLSPQRPMRLPRPRLCEAGPCVHYHRLEVEVEAQDPMPMKVPVRLPVLPAGATVVADGTLYQPPPAVHTQLIHTCYPSSGIEIDLGPAPIYNCNRWTPMTAAERSSEAALRRTEWLLSAEGREYTEAVRRWEDARARETHADAATQAELASLMAAYEAAHASHDDADTKAALEQHRAAYEATHTGSKE